MAELILDINANACVDCGRCIKICTSQVFGTITAYGCSEADPTIVQSREPKTMVCNPKLCIRCGHCVAVCPTRAITHGDFPEGSIHGFDRAARPTPEQTLTLIRSRRSNRAFSGVDVPEGHMASIVEAARRAPTASNARQVGLVQVHSQEVIRQISRLTIDTFLSTAKKLENPFVKFFVKPHAAGVYNLLPKMRMIASAMEDGRDLVLRDAKEVLFFYAPTECRFGVQDANLAYQNASLMAESLDVAHFYTGFVCAAFAQNPKPFLQLLGLDENHKLCAGMALGMPAFKFERYIDRTSTYEFKKI